MDFRQLSAIAAVCVSVGLALSGALREPRHGARALHESAEQDVSEWEEASVAGEPAAHAVQQLHALIESETSINAALSPPPAAASAAPAPAAEKGPKRERVAKPQRNPRELDRVLEPFKVALQRGAVSYRCDASAIPAAKRNKCTRDRALEARVWRVLARLTSCRDATSTLGRAELRLRLAPEAASNASFSAPTIAQSLNLRAVSKCVGGELSKLRATRKLDRFELEIGFGLSGHD